MGTKKYTKTKSLIIVFPSVKSIIYGTYKLMQDGSSRKWVLHMASLFKRGKKWYIDYYDPTGTRIRTAVSPYKETAEKALKKIEIEMAEGKYLDVRKR